MPSAQWIQAELVARRWERQAPEIRDYRGTLYQEAGTLMTALMLSFLLLFTIVAAFVFGIALGYWAICGVLHFFHPARTQRRAAHAPVLAPTASGD